MNEAGDGPRCSLISYVVPPGLSRAPVIDAVDIVARPAPTEAVSAKGLRNLSTREPSSPPPPRERDRGVPSTTSSALPTDSAQLPVAAKSDVTGKTSEQHRPNPHRKSCLTKPPPPLLPARLNLRKKTVAFGKTVNVSQTIEGTSKLSKQKQMMNKSALAKDVATTNENKENEEERHDSETESTVLDILKQVKSSLDTLQARDEERASELRSIRRIVDERGKEVDLLRGMFADYIGRDCPRSSDSKLRSLQRDSGGNGKPTQSSRANETYVGNVSPQRSNHRSYSPIAGDSTTVSRRECDPEDVDDITFEEFRRLLRTNRALRHFVSDLRHEEIYKGNGRGDGYGRRTGARGWRESSDVAQESTKRVEELNRRDGRSTKFTEKVTVERSIRCSPPELAQYSVDTRRYLEDQILDDEGGDVQSMYRPGESVSYYPERIPHGGSAGDLPDSDYEEDSSRRKFHNHAAVEGRRRQRRDRRGDRFMNY
ncbi:hypothetical protein Q1695_003310 [Nippostrongylus brasiliensis]|nr:hypothetical protein Q1695_003310 [Nippostrongylus brasiliensis]